MNILNFKIYGFGNIVSKEYVLKYGVNTIECESAEYAETLRDFIISMFYGLGGRSEGGFRKKYFPGPMIRFGGEMNVEVSGRTFYISQFFGLNKQNDEVKFIETPGSKSISLGNKTIGEILFNLQEPAFRAAFLIDENMGENKVFGYITPELSLSRNIEDSFFIAEKRLTSRLSEIKNNENKDGELDRLVIQKMSKNNELTRLSEQDIKITAKKKQLEALKNSRKELTAKSKKQLRKVMLATSCTALLEKDKILSCTQTVKSDEEQIELLENKRYYIEKRDLKSELKVPVIVTTGLSVALVITAVLALAGKMPMAVPVIFLLAAIVSGVILLLRKADFDNRFTISNGGIKTNIYDEIKHIKRKLNGDVDALLECLGGKTFAEKEEGWRNAEEVLRDASEEERRNAVLKKNEDDENLLTELNAQIKPLDDQIRACEAEIEEMSMNLSTAYTDATASLVGIDDKIKDLGVEYKVTTLAREIFLRAKDNVIKNLMPKIFAESVTIFRETYGDRPIGYNIDDSGLVSVDCYDSALIKQAYIALKLAISKNLFIQESNFTMLGLDEFGIERLPVDLKQVIELRDKR